MKHLTFLATIVAIGFALSSCQDESLELRDTQSSSIQKFNVPDRSNEIDMEQFIRAINSNKERLSKMDNMAKSDCVKTVQVPEDYATIQEAVDAVCDYGNVFVNSGIYNESVIIYKQGLFIEAIGDVTVIGGFGIDADDVKIHKFNIDNTNSAFATGIGLIGFNDLEVKQNNVFGSGHIGIYLSTSNNSSIVQNHVVGEMDYGILIDGYIPGTQGTGWGSCNNNTIAENTVSGMKANFGWGSGIQLKGDCDDNIIQGNRVYSCIYGISLWFLDGVNSNYGWTCDNNIVKNNISNNNVYSGIELGIGGTNNTIGPNNTASNNGDFGIILYDETSSNNTFNNRAINNTVFDIKNTGTNNTFKNNKAQNTNGVD